ncbi:hypothetical protein [Natranaeroarchaeum sulfidigenes]|uniref:hypothetical protein n=1 Tax=Natranaeroarchaeum sulfidigenes TaxID=2784880 RepID=UPI001EE53C37|nr:hypothetical protein [Natranaeroarchaeum sulfidigenes]
MLKACAGTALGRAGTARGGVDRRETPGWGGRGAVGGLKGAVTVERAGAFVDVTVA